MLEMLSASDEEVVSVSKRSKKSKDELLHEVLQDLHPLAPQKEYELEDFLWTGSGEFHSNGLRRVP